MSETKAHTPFIDKLILNQAQREAVLYEGGPQLVFAGAGTGKTRVLTAKIAFLIEEKRIAPGRIFAATFTNKAAREMRARVESLTGLPCAGLWIGTFHSLCARILRREAGGIPGYTPSFSIYDEDDQRAVVKRILAELKIEERAMTPGAAAAMISHWKNRGFGPDDVDKEKAGFEQQQGLRVYREYQKALNAQNAMDFDDLLGNVVRLWQSRPDVLRRYRDMFSYVLVDEYQDTNGTQFELVRLLAEDHGRIFVVGDDDQSIYGWRGAQIRNILSFEGRFAGTRTFKLEENYRSTQAILAFANAAIEPNAERAGKKLWTARDSTAEVAVTNYADDRREAEGVVRAIGRLIGRGAKAGDVMILFRTNAQSRPFEDALRKERVAYAIVGGISFYQRKEIKDCLAYLRLLVNPRDDVSFERIVNVPARGVGPKARAQVATAAGAGVLEAILTTPDERRPEAFAHKGIIELRSVFEDLRRLMDGGTTPAEVLRHLLSVTGYTTLLESDDSPESESRVENVNELLNALTVWSEDHPQGTLSAFLEEVSLIADIDSLAEGADRVSLMTLHSAKGLEAPHVFITGIEDGILPSRLNLDDDDKLAEERRLFYVGITRARDTLTCTCAEQRWRFGSVVPMRRSRFLEAIPSDLYRFTDESAYAALSAIAPQKRSVRMAAAGKGAEPHREIVFDDFSQDEVQIRMGQHVRHKLYGVGRVLSVSGFNADMRVTVLFNDGTRRALMARVAGLEAL